MSVIGAEYEIAQSFAPAEIETETWFEQHKAELLIATALTFIAGMFVMR